MRLLTNEDNNFHSLQAEIKKGRRACCHLGMYRYFIYQSSFICSNAQTGKTHLTNPHKKKERENILHTFCIILITNYLRDHW